MKFVRARMEGNNGQIFPILLNIEKIIYQALLPEEEGKWCVEIMYSASGNTTDEKKIFTEPYLTLVFNTQDERKEYLKVFEEQGFIINLPKK